MTNRKPTKLLDLSGALKRNPKRYKNREHEPKPTEPIGDAPEYLDEFQVGIWEEIKSHCVDGVLTIMNRFALELVVRGLDEVRRGKQIANKETGEVVRVPCAHITLDRVYKQLGKFGMSPGDRSAVMVKYKSQSTSN